jgi:hypothetical protein
MNNDAQLEKETSRIADAIVTLVERTNGPVTLVQVEREIAGFADHEGPSRCHVITHANGETSFWNGVSQAGVAAFRKVMEERLVAIQYVSIVPYLFDGCVVPDEHWQPIVLLPAKAANMATPIGLIRWPEKFLARLLKSPSIKYSKHRVLTPHYAGVTADDFCEFHFSEEQCVELSLAQRPPNALDLISWSNLVSKGGAHSSSVIIHL